MSQKQHGATYNVFTAISGHQQSASLAYTPITTSRKCIEFVDLALCAKFTLVSCQKVEMLIKANEIFLSFQTSGLYSDYTYSQLLCQHKLGVLA